MTGKALSGELSCMWTGLADMAILSLVSDKVEFCGVSLDNFYCPYLSYFFWSYMKIHSVAIHHIKVEGHNCIFLG